MRCYWDMNSGTHCTCNKTCRKYYKNLLSSLFNDTLMELHAFQNGSLSKRTSVIWPFFGQNTCINVSEFEKSKTEKWKYFLLIFTDIYYDGVLTSSFFSNSQVQSLGLWVQRWVCWSWTNPLADGPCLSVSLYTRCASPEQVHQIFWKGNL